ncbi:hypothetical protein J7348_03800 [Qipengyuania flava]|uniref:hypothetical protein n=1 Tax=Qipengyuania flava TaxID=192812 RepID=UPI001ADA12DE|nr:hypothetical protein [Qipengyuania flava]MBO9503740.1 hypothetical protein [Qipengyuania flava]
MNKVQIAAVLAALGMLSGCATYLEEGATKNAAAQCEAMGKQFVKTDSKKKEAIVVASATVTGECVGPEDPRYVAETSNNTSSD